MRIDTEFSLPLPPHEAWRLLLDVPTITPCVPGATLLEELGDNRYRGQAAVRLGPVQLQFTGEIAILEVSETDRTATLRARGTDRGGRGGAAASIRFQLSGVGSESHLRVATDLQLNGAIAQYGRAQGVLDAVAREVARQFADNLRKSLIQKKRMAEPPVAPAPRKLTESAAVNRADPAASTLSLFSLIAAVLKSFFRPRPDA
jgi:carbon monoxide dehydrogenase subunit G